MPFYKNSLHLTPREMEIMNIFWGSTEPLLASGVANFSGLSINTVNAVIKKLLAYEIIEVADIVHSGTVLSRRYHPTLSHQDYTTNTFIEQLRAIDKKMPIPRVVAALLEQEENEEQAITALEKMIAERKRQLRQED